MASTTPKAVPAASPAAATSPASPLAPSDAVGQPPATPSSVTAAATAAGHQTRALLLIPDDLSEPSLLRVLGEISDIRERVEMFHTSQYSQFLEAVFPSIERILGPDGIPPSLMTQDLGHRIRFKALEILNRLPNNEVLKPRARRLSQVCVDVLQRDNEENALIALKIMFELHRNFGRSPQEAEAAAAPGGGGGKDLLEVQPFLDFVEKLYRDLGATVNQVFSFESLRSGGLSHDHAQHNDPLSNRHAEHTMLPGTRSFRVGIECPLIVMLLLQLNKGFIKTGVPVLMPLMLAGLAVRIPRPPPEPAARPEETAEDARVRQELAAKVRAVRQFRFECLCSAQVKTLSFLTYLLLSFAEQMKPHEAEMAARVVALLRIVPTEVVSTRRELLVATRHILATDFHKGFAVHLNSLLDERVLLGVAGGRIDLATGPAPEPEDLSKVPLTPSAGGASPRVSAKTQSLVPLAFNALNDLVQTMRASMTIPQVSRVVYLFSRNVHDQTLPLSVQSSSVRLLLNLVDGIYHHQDHVSSAAGGGAAAGAQATRDAGARPLLVKVRAMRGRVSADGG
jgi:transformation/transcription domain-associated protein